MLLGGLRIQWIYLQVKFMRIILDCADTDMCLARNVRNTISIIEQTQQLTGRDIGKKGIGKGPDTKWIQYDSSTERNQKVLNEIKQNEEKISFDSNILGGCRMTGKLAESWDLHQDLHTVTFKLRQGVRSHWGNELTAEDVKWSWERKLALGAIGGFFASIIGLNSPEQIQNKNVASPICKDESPPHSTQ